MNDYTELLKEYPAYMSMEQMRIVCHISKKTARLLLQTGLIQCKNTGKKTHSYQIRKSTILNYLIERDIIPEKYILPEGSYIRPSELSEIDYDAAIPIALSLIDEYPDVLSVKQAASLSGVMPSTVKDWVKKGCFKTFRKSNTIFIPKILFLDYLKSPQHRRNNIWKQNNLVKRSKAPE